MDWNTLFLSPQGRIGRREFWIGFVLILVASIVLNMLGTAGRILGLLLLWPQICIHAKRLHDMGYSGWLQLVPFGAALVIGTVSAVTGFGALFALTFLVGIAFLLWVGLSPAQPGDNRFGPELEAA